MENQHDLNNIREQLTAIKDNSLKSLENIESINLIMVDDNNGSVKDAKLGAQMARLAEKFKEMSEVISQTEEMLRDK
jgi:hypothetical protein